MEAIFAFSITVEKFSCVQMIESLVDELARSRAYSGVGGGTEGAVVPLVDQFFLRKGHCFERNGYFLVKKKEILPPPPLPKPD